METRWEEVKKAHEGMTRWHARWRKTHVLTVLAVVWAFNMTGLLHVPAHAWTGDVPLASDTNLDPNIFETTLTANTLNKEIKGPGTTQAHMFAFNGSVPGPEIRVTAGDRVIVNVTNNLSEDLTVHWHGIELDNPNDGTPVTQDPIPANGGTLTYDFIAPRPGIFWYHPHVAPTDQTFRGLYGTVIVEDPNEDILRTEGVLPSLANTHTLVLSDTTLCEDVPNAPTTQFPQGIVDACNGEAAGFIPPVQPAFNCSGPSGLCQVREGNTILSNGRMVLPADLLDVPDGQAVRFQVLNASIMRYFRLVHPVGFVFFRVGGEGGLLNEVVVDAVEDPPPQMGPSAGDILLAPADRADFIVVSSAADPGDTITIPADAAPNLNYNRGGATNTGLVVGPVVQLNVTAPDGPNFSIVSGTPLLTDPAVNAPLEDLSLVPAVDLGSLLDPVAAKGAGTLGSTNLDIQFTTGPPSGGPSIDDSRGEFDEVGLGGFEAIEHIESSRFAVLGDVLEMSVENTTGSDHPFHLHGFSFQPISFTDTTDNSVTNIPFVEYIDNINIKPDQKLTYRVKLEDRTTSVGADFGGIGRWVFHCHIFHHAGLGMISELVVVSAPVALCQDVSVDLPPGQCAVPEANASVDNGSFDPDGDAITLEQTPAGPYSIGDTIVTLTVVDSSGLSNACMATVSVNDVTPPEISVEVDPDTLWPPNHKMKTITATVNATDDCSVPTVRLVSIVSNEPDNAPGNGAGNTTNDIQDAVFGTDDREFQLRAERAGSGSGRIYTITYEAEDASGNTATAMATVTVPKNKK